MSEHHSDNCHDVLETTAPVTQPSWTIPETEHTHDFTTDPFDVDDILDEHGYLDTSVDWEIEDSLPRGIGYPAKKGRSLLEDTRKRMQTPHMSYSEFPRYLKNHLPAKIQWDGTTTGFQEYKVAVEGFYTQMYADYLFDKRFQQLYVKHGPAQTVDHPLLPKYIKISRPQLEEAKVHLFGAIKQTTKKSNTVLKFIYRHSEARDGILVWIDLCNTQDNDGNVDVREAKLIRITNQQYSSHYPGGLMKYLDDIDDAYAGLDVLGNKFTSRQKMQNLLNHLQSSHADSYLVSHCRDFFTTFEDCVAYLRKEAVRRADFAGRNGVRRAKRTSMIRSPSSSTTSSLSQEVDLEDIISTCEEINMDPTVENMRTIYKVMTDKESDSYIPPKVWKQQMEFFGPEKMKEFIEFRKKQYEMSKSTQERSNSNQPPIAPKQYQKANANRISQERYSDSESASSEDDLYGSESLERMKDVLDDVYTRVGFMVRKSTTSDYGTTKKHRLIFDTGADTSIIGKGWEVTHYYGPPINLVGFDAQHAKKKGLRACTAKTIN